MAVCLSLSPYLLQAALSATSELEKTVSKPKGSILAVDLNPVIILLMPPCLTNAGNLGGAGQQAIAAGTAQELGNAGRGAGSLASILASSAFAPAGQPAPSANNSSGFYIGANQPQRVSSPLHA